MVKFMTIIDIGASGEIPKLIRDNLKDSFYIGVDRHKITVKAKRIKLYEKILVTENGGCADFYVTKSPYCSSILKPLIGNGIDNKTYYEWKKFNIDWVVRMPSITLTEIVEENDLKEIDILKLDTQGTDLRLLKSCPIKPKIVMVEPGIINAYEGEDKLDDFFKWFRENGYGCVEMKVGYLHKRNELLAFPFVNKLNYYFGKIPSWLEMTWD